MDMNNVRYFKCINYKWPGIYSYVENKHANYITKSIYLKNPLLVQKGHWYVDLNKENIRGQACLQAKHIIELKGYEELTKKEAYSIIKNLEHPKVPKWKKAWKND